MERAIPQGLTARHEQLFLLIQPETGNRNKYNGQAITQTGMDQHMTGR